MLHSGWTAHPLAPSLTRNAIFPLKLDNYWGTFKKGVCLSKSSTYSKWPEMDSKHNFKISVLC